MRRSYLCLLILIVTFAIPTTFANENTSAPPKYLPGNGDRIQVDSTPSIMPERMPSSTLERAKEGNALKITRLLVNDNYMPVVDSTDMMSVLGISTRIGTISLTQSQNNLTFEFVDMETRKIARSQVEYTLRGFDKEYTIARDSVTRVTYTNLPSGTYHFIVRRVVGLYRGIQESTRLEVSIKPPFFATTFAKFLYILITISIIFSLLRLYDLKRLAVKRLDLERRDHQREKEYNQAILRFFTNVSHELRTPLTIISGQLEHILESDNLDSDIYKRVMGAFTSTGKLQSLVDELLDLRKQQSGYATLNLHCVDMAELVKEIFVNYMELAADRGLKYTLDIEECDGIYALADRVEVEKVFFNLLSNAFKFTRAGGVSVTLEVEGDYVVLTVKDTGRGIDEVNLGNIFKQYYQEERNGDFDPSVRGTGIGLALVNHIVKSHNGSINVSSKLGEGSSFTVKLPKTTPTNDEEIAKTEDQIVKEDPTTDVIDDLIDKHRGVKTDQTILVVEDNDPMREFLSDVLSKYYRVEVASDGQEGYEKTLNIMPALVISDVMMPNVSGTQMCTMIKSNYDTSHIPVVLLTAKVAMEHKIQGLAMGADDYITKPFSIKLLISRIDNILRNRRMLLERFSSDPSLDYKQVIAANSKGPDDFLSHAFQTVVDNIKNRHYSVDQFADDMGLGRTKFFKKLKSTVDMTPNDFILTVRLKRAVELLKSRPGLSIGDASDICGFNSQQYFSSCFKRKFGMTPAQYLRSEGQAMKIDQGKDLDIDINTIDEE